MTAGAMIIRLPAQLSAAAEMRIRARELEASAIRMRRFTAWQLAAAAEARAAMLRQQAAFQAAIARQHIQRGTP